MYGCDDDDDDETHPDTEETQPVTLRAAEALFDESTAVSMHAVNSGVTAELFRHKADSLAAVFMCLTSCV